MESLLTVDIEMQQIEPLSLVIGMENDIGNHNDENTVN